jgi:hypothetical protein
MLALRNEYEKEFQKFDQYEPDWMGHGDRSTRRLGISAWRVRGVCFPKRTLYT